jgi:hypothetical protein
MLHNKKFWNQGISSKVAGLLPLHVFKLLVLAAKSIFMQINQVNSIVIPQQKIIMRSLSVPLLGLKSRRDAFVGQSTQSLIPQPSPTTAKFVFCKVIA